ncbi:hypothetical protein D3C72_1235280 [compost metagenome]
MGIRRHVEHIHIRNIDSTVCQVLIGDIIQEIKSVSDIRVRTKYLKWCVEIDTQSFFLGVDLCLTRTIPCRCFFNITIHGSKGVVIGRCNERSGGKKIIFRISQHRIVVVRRAGRFARIISFYTDSRGLSIDTCLADVSVVLVASIKIIYSG